MERLARVALCWALLTACGLLINGQLYGDVAANAWRLREAVIVLAVLLCLSAYRPLWSVFCGSGGLRQVALLGVLGIVGMAQIADRPRATYPFIPWSMYTHTYVIPEYIEYLATLESGRVIELPFHRIIPSNARGSLSHWFSGRLARINEDGPDPPAAREAGRLLVSMAKIYNERYPNEPIRYIDVVYRTIPLHDFKGPASVARRHLVRYTASESPE